MPSVIIITSIEEMQRMAAGWRAGGKTIALVPTMGYLHDGHASLMREARSRCDIVAATIFVNPAQFGAGEDLDSYPRDLQRDTAIAEGAGVDVIFAPKASDMYPKGFQTWIDVERLTLPLCGASRPGHFRGVTTVVCKLFNIVMPDVAFFGKKDFQQLAVIRRMTVDLNLPVEIVGMPIIREEDCLAMSSRNAYLSSAERTEALCLSRALRAARALFRNGEKRADVLLEAARVVVTGQPSATVDYAECRDMDDLSEVATVNERTLLALAVKIGTTRLIDNCVLGEEN